MKIFQRFVILAMLIAFLALAFTGIVKFPETQKYTFFVYNYILASDLSRIHDWSGIILAALIIIHLIINRDWFAEFLNSGYKIPGKISKIFFVAVIVFLIGLGIFYFNKLGGNKSPIQLASAEVAEYKGERLDSINDFRENSIKGVQYVDRKSYNLEITGLVNNPAKYSYEDVLKLQLYQKVVQLNCVEGWSAKILWEGVLARDLIKNLGIKPEAKTVIFYAYDGYSTSFPLDYVLDNDIIMAYKMNGVELPPERGFPFELVAEQKWGYKWIKWITKIELSDDVNYKGFWESRGYNNNGDLSGSKFETN